MINSQEHINKVNIPFNKLPCARKHLRCTKICPFKNKQSKCYDNFLYRWAFEYQTKVTNLYCITKDTNAIYREHTVWNRSNNQPLVIGLFADWGYWYPKT